MNQVAAAYEQVLQFKGDSLKERIAELEMCLGGIDRGYWENFCAHQGINPSLLVAALTLKRASSQINEIVHALGIILSLPHILRDEEMIEYVSLGAGSGERLFDFETTVRIAVFKFTDWKGGSESSRQNRLFKDFYMLAEYDTFKERFLYFVGSEAPVKFLNGRRELRSVLSQDGKLWADFQQKYGEQFKTVGDYYEFQKERVLLVDLAEIVPEFKIEDLEEEPPEVDSSK